MTILVLSTQREYIYINISGLDSDKILTTLCRAGRKRYYKIHGFYNDLPDEDLETIKNQKRYFDSVEEFLKW